jgi:hypothetical protein
MIVATTLGQFQKMLRNVTTLTDVLIQLSENYYLLSRLRPKRIELAGGRSFNLLRHAVGLELASRLYRLLDTDTSSQGYCGIVDRLKEKALFNALMPAFNHDERKTIDDLKQIYAETATLLKALVKSAAYTRINVFRQRFIGHINPTPGMLEGMTPARRRRVDTEQLDTRDIRAVIKRISIICDKLAYMNGRNQFNPRSIATLAADDARELWGLGPPPSRTPSFLLPTGRGRDTRGKK